MYPGHIGWISSKLITRIISLGSSLLGATTFANLIQRKHPWNSGGIGVESLFSANLQYLWNGASYDQGYYWWPIGNRIQIAYALSIGVKINDLGWPWRAILHYTLFSPLSPFHWPQNTWPWMTLSGLNGCFTLYVHYCELPLTNYLLLIYCSLFTLHMWPTHVTSGEVREAE